MNRRAEALEMEGSGESAASLPEDPELPPPGPPQLSAEGQMFDVGGYIRESSAFPFLLIESFWKYSNPRLEEGTQKEAAAAVEGRAAEVVNETTGR
ncbi:unnamed protein product [Sphacelaria rigidula]